MRVRAKVARDTPSSGEPSSGECGIFEPNQTHMDPETIALLVFIVAVVYGWGIYANIQKMN